VSEPLYVIGGRQREARKLLASSDWYEYEHGVLLRVDPAAGSVETLLEYVSPPGTTVDKDPQVLFKSATLVGDRLYATTQTEVIVFSMPDLTQLHHISLPFFNDVHHARPTPDGNILVAVSGLDMCAELTPDGEVVREWSTLDGEEPFTRFSRDIDYRMGISTKPHASHPNYVFYIGDEPWATRFQTRDAVSLNDRSRRIEIGLEKVHDGVVQNGHVYFTTVNGNVVVADTQTLEVEEVIDLNELHHGETLIGWARGLHFAADGAAWVGFSRMRATKLRENVGWVVHKLKRPEPTHIARYDLQRRTLLQEINVEDQGLSAVFSILPAA
jgi:hypothetical protein